MWPSHAKSQRANVIKERRSVRVFRPDAVPDEHLELILDAARCAPTANNNQPWYFLICAVPVGWPVEWPPTPPKKPLVELVRYEHMEVKCYESEHIL